VAIGFGYGSEWHLLRLMGRHRGRFDRCVLNGIGRPGEPLEWADFVVTPGARWPERELTGLEFIEDPRVQEKWREFWPQGTGIHSWDAVGRVGADRELLLVEAKAHLSEVRSDCKATSTASRAIIRNALEWTKQYLDNDSRSDWMSTYYQHANRLAALAFLHSQGVPARLLSIFFVGDTPGGGRDCPASETDWEATLIAQATHIGLVRNQAVSDRVHHIFLHVSDRQDPSR
jgi:hypothetical protein